MIGQIDNEDKETYILGDLNCNLLDQTNLDNDAKHLLRILEIYQLTQLINELTRITQRSKSLMDVCIGGEIRDTKTLNLSRNIVSLHVLVDVSRFSPCVINLTRNKNIFCGLKKCRTLIG